MAREKELQKQKEALKGKVSSNKTNTKSSAPSNKRQLTVETDQRSHVSSKANDEKNPNPPDDKKTPDASNDDDDFGRDDDGPMTREQLEKESSNSAANLDREEESPNGGQFDEKGAMQKTLSSSQLKSMLEQQNFEKDQEDNQRIIENDYQDQPSAGTSTNKEEKEEDQPKEKSSYQDFIDDDDDNDERDDGDDIDEKNEQEKAEMTEEDIAKK